MTRALGVVALSMVLAALRFAWNVALACVACACVALGAWLVLR